MQYITKETNNNNNFIDFNLNMKISVLIQQIKQAHIDKINKQTTYPRLC